MKPIFVFVSGPPGAGKTTMAQRLSGHLGLTLITKDDIKESLFDSLGWGDLEWSKRLGAATWDLIFLLMERLVAGAASAIIESNFYPERQRKQIEAMCNGRSVVEVHCVAEPPVLSERFRTRERHSGHNPAGSEFYTAVDAAAATIANGPLELGPLIEVDTTHTDRIDWDDVVARVRQAMGEKDGSQDR